MAVTCNEIGRLLTRIQADFLDHPDLFITLDEAEHRFKADRTACEAVFGALVDGHVLSCGATGVYRRRHPAGRTVALNHRVTSLAGAAA
jgi:hypothetical protein